MDDLEKLSNIRKTVAVIILGFIALICVSFYIFGGAANLASAKALEREALGAESRIETLSGELAAKEAKVVEMATGMSAERVAKDDAIAQKFLKRVFSWSNSKEYQKLRDELITEYKLDEDGSFLSIFMPEVVTITGVDGKPYNVIDSGKYDISYGGMESYVTAITGDKYSYLTRVDVNGKDKDGHVGDGYLMVEYTIDSDGNMSDFSAFGVNASGF